MTASKISQFNWFTRIFSLKIPGFLLLALLAQSVFAVENIPVWTYYPSPPFTTDKNAGLNTEFIGLLNEHFKGRYHFDLQLIPRTRINRNLDKNESGIVLFVNWIWMGDKDKSKYIWTDAILSDRDEVISRQRGVDPVKVNYSGPESFKGMKYGGITGRSYNVLDESIESGDITRIDVREEEQLLKLLLSGRIDVTAIAATVIHYKVKQNGLENEVFFSSNPLYAYTRHLLLTRDLEPIYPEINEFIQSLEKSEKWSAIKNEYAVN